MNLIRCSITVLLFLITQLAYTMEKNITEKLKDKYPLIKNNISKLQDQLICIEKNQKKGNNSITLEEYRQKISERCLFLETEKEFNKLLDSQNCHSKQAKEICKRLQQNCLTLSHSTTLSPIKKNKIVEAFQYLTTQLSTFTLFENPKKISEYIPLTKQERYNTFLPFNATTLDNKRNTLLMWGVDHKLSLYGLKYLIECGISCNEKNNDNETVLHKAVEQDPAYVRFILHQKIKLQKTKSALELYENLKQTIEQQYIDQKTLNAQDNRGRTALHKACIKKCTQSVKLLLQAGADTEIKDITQKTWVEILYTQPWDEFSTEIAYLIFAHAEKLLEPYPKLYSIINALSKKEYDRKHATTLIQELITKKVETIYKTPITIPQTANTQSSQKPKKAQAAPLKKNIPQPPFICTHKPSMEKDPTIFSKMNKIDSLKKFLKNNKNNINAKNRKGSTPLQLAITKGNLPLATVLLDNGADANMPCHIDIVMKDTGQKICTQLTPLETCCLYNPNLSLPFLRLLATYGADFGVINSTTLLHRFVNNSS